MRQIPEEVLFDSRLVERHIREGLTTYEAWQAYKQRLEDMAEQVDSIDLEALQTGVTSGGAKRGTKALS